MKISTVILAAGQGTRMHSSTPKVLHRIAGKTLLEHVIQTAKQFSQLSPIVVYGHQGEMLQKTLNQTDVIWVHQPEQLGTGHAVSQALSHIPEDHQVLILYGDVPLISHVTLSKLLENTTKNALGILTAHAHNPQGLGRIIRGPKNKIIKIIEEKDATEKEKQISEINTGIYLVPASYLKKWLPKLDNHNAQKEYYLTDIIEMALHENISIIDTQPDHAEEILGVNTRHQLAQLERYYQRQQAKIFLQHGVTLMDPHRFDVRGDVVIGQDTTIDINVILEGDVKIGERCVIGPHCILRNVTVGNDVEIRAHSILDGAMIDNECIIGPFARIRPGTKLAHKSHVGNFVEIKNSSIGVESKINHLSYVGDSQIGKQVNIGAGTITCNYDGVNKHRTTIGDYVFVGSNSALVAPVTIHDGATIGAGSTITRDAPPNQLTLSRERQKTIENWQRPVKAEKER